MRKREEEIVIKVGTQVYKGKEDGGSYLQGKEAWGRRNSRQEENQRIIRNGRKSKTRNEGNIKIFMLCHFSAF